MPISSMQFRESIGKHEKRNFSSRHKPIQSLDFTDTTRLSEFIKSIGDSCITLQGLTYWEKKQVLPISIQDQYAVRTSLLLLLFFSQISISNASETVEDFWRIKNSSRKAEVPSWHNEIDNIPLNIGNDKSNRVISFNFFPFPIAEAATPVPTIPTFHPVHNTKYQKIKAFPSKILPRITRKLHRFLERQGLLQKDRKEEVTKEEIILHTLEYSLLESKNAKHIARTIFSINQTYHRKGNKTLSVRESKEIIRNWVFTTIWHTSLIEYVVKFIAKDPNRLYYTIEDIVQLLSLEKLEQEKTLNLHKLQEQERFRFTELWHALVKQEFPFIHFYTIDRSIGNLFLESVEFSDLYTGACYLSELTSLNCCTPLEVLELGKKMWENAAKEGIRITTQPYFLGSALFFEAQNAPQFISEVKDLQDITETVIIDHITYRTLAQQINKSMISKLSFFKDSLQRWNAMSEQTKDIHKEEYLDLIEKMREYFSELDEYLIVAGLNTASHEEKNFIFSPDAITTPIAIRKKRKNIKMAITPFYGMQCYNEYFKAVSCNNYLDQKILLNKTDLFSVHKKNEERIYALKSENNGYKFLRLDRDIAKYLELKIFNCDELKSGQIVNKNEIKINNKLFTFSFDKDKNFSPKKNSITELINFFRNRHSDEFYISLYELGYHVSNFQKIGDILRHFIPLHDCIEGILWNHKEQASFSCFFDALLIFPSLEGSLEMIEKLGLYVAKELRTTGLSLSKNSFSFVSSSSALLKELDLSTMTSLHTLQKNIYSTLDSVFQFLGVTSKKYTDAIINFLSNDDKTAALGEKIRNIALEKKVVDSYDPYITARLPHLQIRVPIRKVGERRGEEIYTVFNPQTRQTAWGRFTLKENNELVLLEVSPLSVSKALERSITEDMYAEKIDLHSLSEPDYMGVRWDFQHVNGYLNYKNNWLKLKILNDQFFLISEKGILPLRIKNYELVPENMLERILRLKKQGFAGTHPIVEKVIATKLNISEKESSDLLNSYKFPDDSYYYTKETFALWIEKTGQIPSWAEDFKILDRDTYVSRFTPGELQPNGLYSFLGGTGYVYRVDRTPPHIVLHHGFNPTEDYGALEKMIPEEEAGLTTAGDLRGALRYNEWVKSPYIYAIKIEEVRGGSLQENVMKNARNLKEFLGESPEETYMTIESVAEDSNGAIYLDEIHLYHKDIKPHYISLVTKEEIEAEMPLSEGPWQKYL